MVQICGLIGVLVENPSRIRLLAKSSMLEPSPKLPVLALR